VSAFSWLSTWFSQTRGPPKRYVARFVIGTAYLISNLCTVSYVDSLETRLEKMEGMLSRVRPYHLGVPVPNVLGPAVSGRRLLARDGA
jgi:hypothetical protein